MHDRRKPATRGNIDHVAVGPGGVTVIDTKKLKGRVRVTRRGFLHRHAELRVGGRDRTVLVAGVEDQARAVRVVLARHGLADVPVSGALQFVDGDLPLFGLPAIRGVTLGWPRKVARLARRPGALSPDEVTRVAQLLDRELPPA